MYEKSTSRGTAVCFYLCACFPLDLIRHSTFMMLLLEVAAYRLYAILPFAGALLFCIYSQQKKPKYGSIFPPYSPLGRWETMKEFCSENCTSYILKIIKLDITIFRMRPLIPFRRKPFLVEVTDVQTLRQVLKDETSTKPDFVYSLYLKVHKGNFNIFSSEGPKWKHSRKAIASAFSSKHVNRMNTVVKEKTDIWVTNKLIVKIENGEPIDVASEMLHLTLCSICEAAFQYSITDNEAENFLKELHLALMEAAAADMPFRKYISRFLSSSRRASVASDRLIDFSQKVLDAYRSLECPIEGTVIDCIAKNSHYENDKDRVADIFIMLVGGHDTTAYTISWTMFELAKHQEEQKKLRSMLHTADSSARLHVPKLHHVIKEAMRLHPVAAMGTCRKIASDLIIKREDPLPDYFVPEGSIIMVSIMGMMRNERYYKDPDSFKPSRWENPTKDEVDAFMPFLIGRRNCVGQSLAHSNLRIIVSTLIQNYDWAVENPGTATCFFTYAPKNMTLKASRIADK